MNLSELLCSAIVNCTVRNINDVLGTHLPGLISGIRAYDDKNVHFFAAGYFSMP